MGFDLNGNSNNARIYSPCSLSGCEVMLQNSTARRCTLHLSCPELNLQVYLSRKM